MIKFIALFLVLFIASCNTIVCTCGNVNCGPDCRNKCEGDKCYPGVPCCDKCICGTLSSIKK